MPRSNRKQAVCHESDLARRAEAAGIVAEFDDYFGNRTLVSDATKTALLATMGDDRGDDALLAPVCVVRATTPLEVPVALPHAALTWTIALEAGGELAGTTRADDSCVRVAALPCGYHRLRVADGRTHAACVLIAVPPRCYLTADMQTGRVWALGTQLYALRSQSNWGVGDFSDLGTLAELAGRAGAGAVALNPLHELFPHNPQAASPYAPSSRFFLNAIYIDVAAVPDARESERARAYVASAEFARRLRALRDSELVDYAGVMRVKLDALQLAFEAFCANHLARPAHPRASAFRAFVRAGGQRLQRFARYEALAEHFRARDPHCYGWMQWPAEFRSAPSPAVERFARTHRDRVDFFCYLQWVADEQLARAATRARRSGVALYRDLAVGVDRNGADAWSDPDSIAIGASLGAPADPLNTQGQNWGLPPLSPRALRDRAYAPFVALLRANMRHAGMLRIDHAMALRRAFWIPHGRLARDGAYVGYPLDDLLGIVALESQRNHCVVVGEDLGTVPEGFRERLAASNALSSRLLYFERAWDGAFDPPSTYPRLAAASVGTHDLPPLLGWWTGNDDPERQRDRSLLVDALVREECIGLEGARRLREDAAAGGTTALSEMLSEAVHRYLARTPSMLAVVAIEDVLGEVEAVNVPGTVDEHPNWRRKRTIALEAIAGDGRLFSIGAAMRNPWNPPVRPR